MAVIDQKLMDVAARDARYAYEAYDFILKALDYTEGMLGRHWVRSRVRVNTSKARNFWMAFAYWLYVNSA